MKNLLIADAGSSKVKWTLLSGSDVAMTFVADGLNALLAEQEEVDGKLTDVRQRLGDRTIDEVYY